ncbi:hypothetical protein [Chelativorans sp. YIM 93263]|uniref:hypothetical protein n=1 Tax=Chelativorans sp. YIM 93263 TaxID=2906648 RepID=UPI0023796427|nr:hypothetical protein [Chelativorans sp. YIM 93263]
MEEHAVSGYSFRPDALNVDKRPPGLSAFMRIRNGEDFLEAAIRSHIPFFDEVVAVYNQCTDATPDILARLAQEYGPKLRVIHYLDRVHPPGSSEHASEPPNSPHSLVNYYNFALAQTRFQIATKLDDDHLAIPDAFQALCKQLRAEGMDGSVMHCFSGINLMRDGDSGMAIAGHDTIAGNGDHGFFRVTSNTYFTHDKRFERLERDGAKRVFWGFLYWHLKYLKPSLGFANYELKANPESRYGKKLDAARRAATLDPDAFLSRIGRYDPMLALEAVFSSKQRIRLAQRHALREGGLPEPLSAVEQRLAACVY